MAAGRLSDRVTFESRSAVADEYGNERAEWTTQFSRNAEVIPLKGGEGVIAARLAGTQPVVIRVRYDAQTATIAPDWRATDRAGVVYALRTATDMERKREYITMMAEAGRPA